MAETLPLTLAEVLFEELQAQRLDSADLAPEIDRLRAEKNWDRRSELSECLVSRIYAQLNGPASKLPRSALCLSGGGVRSATFNLGILQGLARCGLLGKFDYLSTVSGGGFIGSWLSAWIHRKGAHHVMERLSAPNQLPARCDESKANPLKPEPEPLYNLRVYANYLTPKKGLLSADTWTLVAIYARNLFLNWCVFLPVIMAGLLLPRVWLAFVSSSFLSANTCLYVGLIAGVISLSYISLGLPSSRAQLFNRNDTWFVFVCLAPLVVTAMGLTAYWARLESGAPRKWSFIIFGAAMSLLPLILIIVTHIIATQPERKEALAAGRKWELTRKLVNNVAALSLIIVAFGVTSFLFACILRTPTFSPASLALGHPRLYAALAVPVLLVMLTGGGTLIAGFTSHFTDVDDQEWWARVGAWILIVALGWSVIHLLVLFAPSVLREFQILVIKREWSWASLKGVVTAIIGFVSGAISLFGGFSSKTNAHGSEEHGEDDSQSTFAGAVLPVSATIFAGFLIICFAQITNLLIASAAGTELNEIVNRILKSALFAWLNPSIGTLSSFTLSRPREFVLNTPGPLLVAMAVVLFVLGGLLGRLINTNRFSLHYYWRNRMMRAYLGASRNASDREKTRNKFTDFDEQDNLRMYQLNQKPLHVVNVTLNLTGGDKLEWQDRRAESFTMSPLHCGSYWLGYRKSKEYAQNTRGEGISLATAVAISGAAASPNMGYMMTSSVVRFIMTLFNIRMGFWLGNPGPNGAKHHRLRTYSRDSPRESVRPIVEEALGKTNDRKPYVYLSDGGHFENFGLYEMILRRCRFVVVSDASTDTKYAYESLAMAIRQIRVDFGVPIDMGTMNFGNHPDASHNYCALGLIKYACIDRAGGSREANEDAKYDGVLVYVKPSLIGDEPRDILNYHSVSKDFPEETIADQWFSESQFESYRALGSHMIEKICLKHGRDRKHKPKQIEIGARVSSAVETGSQEFSIKGWIDKLAASGTHESDQSDLEKRIEAVIASLIPDGKTLNDLGCGDFSRFAAEAQQHVDRHRESSAKEA